MALIATGTISVAASVIAGSIVPLMIGAGCLLLGVKYYQKKAGTETLNGKKQLVLDDKTLMRLAGRLGGSMTASELSLHTKLTMEEASIRLDEMYARGLADIKFTDEGAMVYKFLQLPPSRGDKNNAKQLY